MHWSINAEELRIAGTPLAGHRLLSVHDDKDEVRFLLNGLATGPGGDIKPIGFLPDDLLRVCEWPEREDARYRGDPATRIKLFEDSEDQVMIRWGAARAAAERINCLNDGDPASYPFLGLGKNSNSVFTTLVHAMGFTLPELPKAGLLLPGHGEFLLSDEDLAAIRDTHGIPHPKPAD